MKHDRITATDDADLAFAHSLAPVKADAVLLEIIGHLGAAISQSIPSDDQIIMEHVRPAHELASLLRRAQS